MASQRDILIVGSVPLADAEAVFRTLAGALGSRLRRIPDGETGARINWIESQAPVFERHPMFELAAQEEGKDFDWRNHQAGGKWKLKPWQVLKAGADPHYRTHLGETVFDAVKENPNEQQIELMAALAEEGVRPPEDE